MSDVFVVKIVKLVPREDQIGYFREEDIFEQRVPSLDVAAVIRAVNGFPPVDPNDKNVRP